VTVPRRVTAIARTPLVRTSGALVVNTGINGALGLAYWVMAARLLEPSVVGLGAGGYSGMVFAASLGWIGLQHVLLRYLPTAGRRGLDLIVGIYVAAIALALLAAVVFLAYASTDPSLDYLVESPLSAAGFLAAVLIWVVFSLQDPALIGLRRAPLVPIENLAFGTAKLVLLLLLAGLASPWSILVSWILGASWLVAIVSVVIRRTLRALPPGGNLPERRRLVQFSAGQHAIAVLAAAPDSLVPLLVLAYVGDEATAFYVAAWQLTFAVRLIAVNVGYAVTVEGSVDGGSSNLGRQVRILAPAMVVPAVAIVIVIAPLILAVFGRSYAANATDLLRLQMLAILPFTAVTLFVVGERIAERTVPALVVTGATTLTALVLDVLLLPVIGLVAAGWSWLAAQLLAAALAGIISWRRRRPTRQPAR
jgi:O-antigen/teichoic acid export membrane protein